MRLSKKERQIRTRNKKSRKMVSLKKGPWIKNAKCMHNASKEKVSTFGLGETKTFFAFSQKCFLRAGPPGPKHEKLGKSWIVEMSLILNDDNNMYRIAWRLYRNDGLIINGNGSRIFTYQQAIEAINYFICADKKNEYDYYVD